MDSWIFKPTHATYRPGLYLSHFPGVPKLDLRAEAVNTDSSHPSSVGGRYQYWEVVQRQGYTNQGQLFGDWIGREDKGASDAPGEQRTASRGSQHVIGAPGSLLVENAIR